MNTQINLVNTWELTFLREEGKLTNEQINGEIKRLLEELSEVAQGKQEIKHYHIKQFPLGEDDYISEFKTI